MICYQKAAERGHAKAQFYLGLCFEYAQGTEKDEAKAAEWYYKAAQQGLACAQYSFAVCLEKGQGVKQDEKQAVAWHQKAAQQGFANAQYNLAMRHESGQGVEKSEAQAVSWHQKAAEQGHAEAQCNLGVRYENGQGVEKSEIKAAQCYAKAAKQGHTNAQYHRGVCFHLGKGVKKDAAKAVKCYERAADKEHANAEFMLASCYENGEGVKENKKEAVIKYREAAQHGLAKAQHKFGFYLQHGLAGVIKKDKNRARIWYRKAAAQGFAETTARLQEVEEELAQAALRREEFSKKYSVEIQKLLEQAEADSTDAQFDLGCRYFTGQGVEKKDEKEAVKWFFRAAKLGNADAQHLLGFCLERGLGVEKDEKEAVKWSRNAAEQGHAGAQFNLAIYFLYGQGTEKDEAKAVEWFRKAAEQGLASAQVNLGTCYDHGRGVEKDEKEAVTWYRNAAEQGDADAQYNLAFCFDYGQGVGEDKAEAMKWYRMAAEQGNGEAQIRWKELEKKLTQTTSPAASISSSPNSEEKKEEKESPPSTTITSNKLSKKETSKKYSTKIQNLIEQAETGDREAQYDLGRCYQNGQNIEKDEKAAIEWFQKAANQGYAWAQDSLGNCYAHGQGVEQDQAQGAIWYRRAAEQGHAWAQNSLGDCYAFGEGVEKNVVEAVKWYRKAAEKGLANAQYVMGLCYAYGQGVEKDETEAVKWYRMAAEQGHSEAQSHWEELEKKLTQTTSPAASISSTPSSEVKKEEKESLLTTTSEEHSSTKKLLTVEEGETVVSKHKLAIITSASQVPSETFAILAQVSPQALQTFASARPSTLRKLIEMGENAEQVEEEFKEIQNNPRLQEYYDFFQRAVTAFIVGSWAVREMTEDKRQTPEEKLISLASENIEIPFLKGTITKLLQKIAGFGADRQRTVQVNNLTICFPTLQNAGVLVEALARCLVLAQKADILAATQSVPHGRLKKFIARVEDFIKWAMADDVNTQTSMLAVKQANILIKHLMGKKATQALVLKDVPELVKVATGDKVIISNPVSPSACPGGLPAHSFFATPVSSAQAVNFNPTLLTQTVTAVDTKAADAHRKAIEAEQKATEANTKAANAHKKGAKAEQKADVLEQALAEERAKRALLEQQVRQLKDREEERIVKEAEDRASTARLFKKMERELSLARSQANKVNELVNLFVDDGKKKEEKIQMSAVEKIDRGLDRLQQRGDAATNAVTQRMDIIEEEMAVLRETHKAHNSLLRQLAKSQKAGATFLRRSNVNVSGAVTSVVLSEEVRGEISTKQTV